MVESFQPCGAGPQCRPDEIRTPAPGRRSHCLSTAFEIGLRLPASARHRARAAKPGATQVPRGKRRAHRAASAGCALEQRRHGGPSRAAAGRVPHALAVFTRPAAAVCQGSPSAPPRQGAASANARIAAGSGGGSSAGRALRSQCRGREFDPPPLHHRHQSRALMNMTARLVFLLAARASSSDRRAVRQMMRRRISAIPDLGRQGPPIACPAPGLQSRNGRKRAEHPRAAASASAPVARTRIPAPWRTHP